MKKQLISELKDLIDKGLKDMPFPYVRGNSIRIGCMVIRSSKHGFLVYDTQKNKQVAHTFSKSAAVAIGRTCSKGLNFVTDVLTIDAEIEKNFNDAVFYRHGSRKTKDPLRQDVLEVRLDIATSKSEQARSRLDKYIYN